MHISHLAPLILTAYSSVCFANPLFVPKAVSRSTIATNPSSLNDLTDPSEPTCLPPDDALSTSSSNDLDTFSSDCITAANTFFNAGIVSRTAWHWKRLLPEQAPQPGYNFLPYAVAPLGCMLELDVLDDGDPDAEDQFALVQIAPDFRRLFNKCVKPSPRALVKGFVPVGPRKVLKLSIGPTPMSASLVKGGSLLENGTRLMNVISQT